MDRVIAKTATLDYIVATMAFEYTSVEQVIRLEALVREGEAFGVSGYKGKKLGKYFVGDNGRGRLMAIGTGLGAEDVASLIDLNNPSLSIARLDIQTTFWVQSADYFISTITPPRMYKCVLTKSLYERGSTLYIGSPKSRVRARAYNKTAEIGEEPSSLGELLRIEIQLRDEYADRGFTAYKQGLVNSAYLFHVKRMFDAYTYHTVEQVLNKHDVVVLTGDEEMNSWERRKQWLEDTVLPSIAKLVLHDKDFVEQYVEKLKKLLDI